MTERTIRTLYGSCKTRITKHDGHDRTVLPGRGLRRTKREKNRFRDRYKVERLLIGREMGREDWVKVK